tara:strand:- start:1550 stop:2065 length:516 start_codon:yes stop_codon:yes gene_type:complete
MAGSITKYEAEFLDMMSDLNSQMMDLAGSDLMTDEALRQLSISQMEQHKKTKKMFATIQSMIKSEYWKKRRGDEANLETKRKTELEKRKDAKENPEKYFICQRCDSIFTRKENLARHQGKALKCGVIKQTKKGALEVKNHKSWKINNFIADHLEDEDSDEEGVEANENNEL